MNFIPWDLKKIDKIAWPWNLTLTGEIEFWWHIYNFDNLNLIAEWISILCMSLFYTKWRKSNYFEEFRSTVKWGNFAQWYNFAFLWWLTSGYSYIKNAKGKRHDCLFTVYSKVMAFFSFRFLIARLILAGRR